MDMPNNSFKRHWLFIHTIICIFLVFPAFCQAPEFDANEMIKFAGDKKSVVLEDFDELEISIEKGKPKIINRRTEKILYLREANSFSAERTIPYSERFFDLVDLQACTWVPQAKGGFQKVKAPEASRYSNISEDLFYDDMMQAKLMLPALQQGAVTEFSYTYDIKDPRFIFPFYFKSGYRIPVLKTHLRLIYPNNVELSKRFFGDTTGIKSSRKEEKGKIIEEFWLNKIQPEKDYEHSPTRAYFSPHVFFILKSYTVKGETTKLLGDVEDLYKQNYAFIKDFNADPPSPEMKTVVDSLLAELNTRDTASVVKKLFYWVQDHIKYIAIEDGLGGYIPRPPNAVLHKRYGDCKDKAALLQAMLKQAGIASSLCWIGSRDIPYTFAELPLMASMNHMILAWKNGTKWEFLDATAQQLPMGFPSTAIQGKQALIAIDEQRYEVDEVPFVDYKKNYLKDSLFVEITPESKVKAKGSITYGGFVRVRLNNALNAKNEKEQEDFIQGLIKGSNHQFKVTNYVLENLDDREKPLRIVFELEMPDYIKKIDAEYFLNLNIRKQYSNERIDDLERNVPLTYLFNIQNQVYTSLKIPENFSVKRIPENKSFSNELIDFNQRYRLENDKVILNGELGIKQMVIKPSEFNGWNDGFKLLNKAFKENLTLIAQ